MGPQILQIDSLNKNERGNLPGCLGSLDSSFAGSHKQQAFWEYSESNTCPHSTYIPIWEMS